MKRRTVLTFLMIALLLILIANIGILATLGTPNLFECVVSFSIIIVSLFLLTSVIIELIEE